MEFQSELTSNALTKGQGAHGKLGEFLVSFYIYTMGDTSSDGNLLSAGTGRILDPRPQIPVDPAHL